MKNKLESIKAALEGALLNIPKQIRIYQGIFYAEKDNPSYTKAEEAITTLNELIETLEGEGLAKEDFDPFNEENKGDRWLEAIEKIRKSSN